MALVRARVRPSNNYGGDKPEGSIVNIEEAELEAFAGCLERVEDEPEPAAAEAEAETSDDGKHAKRAPKSSKR